MNRLSPVAQLTSLVAVTVTAVVGLAGSASAAVYGSVVIEAPRVVIGLPLVFGPTWYAPYRYDHGRHWRYERYHDRHEHFERERDRR